MIIYDINGAELLSVDVDDKSYRNRRVMGDHNLTLYFSLEEHIEIPVGSYCEFEGERYTLELPENLTMKHSRYFDYTAVFESSQVKAKRWKFRNTVDGRLRFTLTARPHEHLQMFVENMNRRDSGWTVGDCIEGVEVLISYDHCYCYDALSLMATELNTEFEIKGKRVSLRKIEYNKDNPLSLSYGRGNGFKSGVGRSNDGDNPPVEILFVQGGTDNIDASRYGSSELLLPKGMTLGYDGEHFEGQEGFNQESARIYVVDGDGLSIHRQDKPFSTYSEDSLDCSAIYPKRIGTVSSVEVVDAEKNFYDFVDSSIPAELNYEDWLIAGETMTVIFQSGMLAGREFEVKYIHNAKNGKAARRFEIVPQELDGQTMPNATFSPKAGDQYAVFHCSLPDAYIRNDADRSGASWDMFREAVKYLFENEETKFSFKGELDGIWAKKDWVNIGGRIVLGGCVRFTDDRWQKEPILVRIVGIKDYINNPHSPEIELSNSAVGTGFASVLKELEAEEVIVEENYRNAIRFTQRRYRDAKETMQMLEESLLENFTQSINPIAVQTMQMLVGDESLQFQFIKSLTNDTQVADTVVWDEESRQLKVGASFIQHLTLGIKSLSSGHESAEYKKWALPEYASAVLTDGTKKYYLYAKCSMADQTGEFILSESAIKLETGTDYYLLVGVLNSEYDGARSYASLYGYSEVLPGRVTTDRVVSGNGKSYFDMLNEAMKLGDSLDFNSKGDRRLRIKGTIVQSEGGEAESPIGCYRGIYSPDYTYYQGDEVAYSAGGVLSTYRHTSSIPTKGVVPTETAYWEVVAQGVKGDPGEKGIPGEPGEDGRTSYLHIAYANSADGKTDFSVSDSAGKEYMGQYTDFVSDDSTDPTKYKWTKIKGEQGIQGLQGLQGEQGKQGIPGNDGKDGTNGKDGADGRTSYFHIKYAPVINPTAEQMTETPSEYIGTYVDFTELDSTDPSAYTWARFEGMKGDTGIAGVNGEDGKTSYLHIKYSDDGGQSFTTKKGLRKVSSSSLRLTSGGALRLTASNVGEEEGYYIGTYVDYEPEDSTDVFRYKWVKIKGEQGDKGDPAHSPYVGENGNWYIFDDEKGEYIDSGWSAEGDDGHSPYIGENGNWFEWDAQTGEYVDTGTKAKGDKGDAGDYYEYRYSKNGSTAAAPTLDKNVLSPNGWCTVVPAVGSLEYLWMTIAKISGDGKTLLQAWSEPIRFTPKDGAQGSQGFSPALVFRGDFDANATYYGNPYRVDAVKVGDSYYVTRVDAEAQVGVEAGTGFDGGLYPPQEMQLWNSFGASFESVATNLLLAENANIAGWIFRNGRLESQSRDKNGNPMAFLNGESGEMRLRGTMQLSTGYAGNISDKNLFYLPAITSTKNLSMGHEREDIGKVCRLYNSSPYGGATYQIYVTAFGIKSNFTDATIGSDFGMNYYVLVPPQSTVELTCFELPNTFNGKSYDIVGRWDITSRFDTDNFKQSAAIGRFPRVLAIGSATCDGSTAWGSGYYYDGRTLSSVFDITCGGTGVIILTMKSGTLPDGYFVLATGNGTAFMKATVYEESNTVLKFYISDDSSPNNGSCYFVIFAPLWWYNMQ